MRKTTLLSKINEEALELNTDSISEIVRGAVAGSETVMDAVNSLDYSIGELRKARNYLSKLAEKMKDDKIN